MAVDERKPIKGFYNGYINYYDIKDPAKMKSYNFHNLSTKELDALKERFSGPGYRYVGTLAIKNKG